MTVTSISKGWNVPGLKCALLQAQPGTARVVDAVPAYERLRASVPGVAASIAAWFDDGGWLDELRQHLDRTRAELAAWVRRTPGVRAHPGTAGYLAWLDLRDAGLGDDPARLLLERGRLAVSPGHDFALAAEQGTGQIRLNHGTSLPLVREALRRIERTIEGVMLSHANLITSALGSLITGAFGDGGRFLAAAPMFHMGGLIPILSAFVTGGTHVAVPRFDPVTVMRAIERHRVTDTVLIPIMIQLLVVHPQCTEHDLSSLQRLVYGGSPISVAVLDRARKALPQTSFVVRWLGAYR